MTVGFLQLFGPVLKSNESAVPSPFENQLGILAATALNSPIPPAKVDPKVSDALQ